jgi:hypothetical protein
MEHLQLELGDIVKVQAPSNQLLHDHSLYVSYIDDQKYTKWVDIESLETYTIEMNGGKFDKAAGIEKIILLSRSTEAGYARQHGLVIGTWIDIHLSGDQPFILTACITNLEEDMIELSTYVPDGMPSEKLYIDFAYKGIPEEYPITEICIRDIPLALQKKDTGDSDEEKDKEEEYEDSDFSLTFHNDGTLEIVLPANVKPDETYQDKLYKIQQEVNQTSATNIPKPSDIPEEYNDEDEDSPYNAAFIPKHLQRYKIDAQLNDLYSDFLSRIPDSKRTTRILRNITNHIRRFEELRTENSTFDETQQIARIPAKDPINYKPLLQSLLYDCTGQYSWIKPVVTLQKKCFVYDDTSIEAGPDVQLHKMGETFLAEKRFREQLYEERLSRDTTYLSYEHMLEETKQYITPFHNVNSQDELITHPHHTIPIHVNTDMDMIISNRDGFLSTTKHMDGYINSECIVQRYTSPVTYFPHIRKNTAQERILYSGDNANVRGFLFYPLSLATHYSRKNLPGANIMIKSSVQHDSYYPYNDYVLKKARKRIDIFEGDKDHPIHPKEKKSQYISLYPSHLTEENELYKKTNESDYVESRLSSMLPNTFSIIEHYEKKCRNIHSLSNFMEYLEPFGIYLNTLTSNSLGKIYRVLKDNNFKYLEDSKVIKNQFQDIRAQKYKQDRADPNRTFHRNTIAQLFNSNPVMVHDFLAVYGHLDKSNNIGSSSDFLKDILLQDNLQLYSLFLRLFTVELTNSEDFFRDTDLQPGLIGDEYSEQENRVFKNTIDASDCYRKILTKEYNSVRDLESDNNNTELFYDTALDNTNYAILDKYKQTPEYKKSNEEFLAFLAEQLVRKHHCPTRLAREMAETLVRGSKKIQEGEYAKLIVSPRLPSTVDENSLSAQTKADIEIEKAARKKVSFFVRKRNVWVLDKDVDESSFLHTKTLFCNLQDKCYQKDAGAYCENIELDTKSRMLRYEKERMTTELQTRYQHSIEEESNVIERMIEKYKALSFVMRNMLRIRKEAFSQRAFQLGKLAIKNERLVSPHWSKRSHLLHKSISFDERQSEIVQFYQLYCREPLDTIEDIGWKYCRETNTPLLESSLYELACAYENGEYMKKLNILVKRIGILSDDEGCIVDKYTGCVLKQREFAEDGGFLQTLEDIDERDTDNIDINDDDNSDGVALSGKLKKVKTKKNTTMYENQHFQHMYEILNSICSKTFIPNESIETNAMRICTEVFENSIMSEKKYKKLQNERKDKKQKMVDYPIYVTTTKVKIASCAFIISVQSLIPSFKTSKYERTCDKRFDGYPIDIEDTSNTGLIKYVACVVRLLYKGNTDVSISQKSGAFENTIFSFIKDHLLQKEFVHTLLEQKRDHIKEIAINEIIPEHLQVPSQWYRFSPPTYSIDIMGKTNMTFVTSAFYKQLESDFKTGSSNQWNGISVYSSKIELFTYGIIHMLENILQNKPIILTTMSKIPFQQNACCNDSNDTVQTALEYFTKEDDRIGTFVKSTTVGSRHLRNFKKMIRAPFLHLKNEESTEKDAHLDKNAHVSFHQSFDKFTMYNLFFHYCKYDSKTYVLPEDLRAICPERPPEYDPMSSLEQKIEFMNEKGKSIKMDTFVQLMSAVNRRNMFSAQHAIRYDWKASNMAELNQLLDNMKQLQNTNSSNMMEKAIQSIITFLQTDEIETNEQSDSLLNNLTFYNSQMNKRLTEYIKKHAPSSEKKGKREKIVSTFFQQLFPQETCSIPFMERMVVQYIYLIAIVFPLYVGTNQRINTACTEPSGLTESDSRKMALFISVSQKELTELKGKDLSILTKYVVDILKPIHAILPFISQYSTESELICTVYQTMIWMVFDVYLETSASQVVIQETRELLSALKEELEEEDVLEDVLAEDNFGTLSQSNIPLGNLLTVFLKYGSSPEKQIHMKSYEEIKAVVQRSKEIEKNEVKRYFAKLKSEGKDAFASEVAIKLLHLGKYNIKQSDLIRYGKKIENFFQNDDIDSEDAGDIIHAMENNIDSEYNIELGMNENELDDEDIEDALIEAEEENEYGDDNDVNDIFQFES